MEDIDAMFSEMLGEMDLLTKQSLDQEIAAPLFPPSSSQEASLSIGLRGVLESLQELEDNDLDALMADLMADINATEQKLVAERDELKVPSPPTPALPPKRGAPTSSITAPTSPEVGSSTASSVSSPASSAASPLPAPPPQSTKPSMEEMEAQMKADKIKLALEKLKEAKVKKLVVKVLLNDGSSKTLMVDERQSVREVLDNLFEKTHCNCNVDWSLCETNAELQLAERTFEDHENLVEPLLAWTRDSQNQVLFQERPEKNEVFRNPQNFYLWKKDKKTLRDINDKDKEILIKENFCGTSIIVPDLEAVLHLREDGKKSWKQRLFQLRASGIYYVPKGKTKSSRDLVCFVQLDNLNVYYGKDFRNKYKAPTDFCFVLKHPQIQKESQYIKYLCCDDAWTLNLWLTGIRIAKYGAQLHHNYQTAVKKASVTSVWANRSAPSPGGSPAVTQPNGHVPTAPGAPCQDVLPPPPLMEVLPPPPPDPVFPPPPPPLMAKGSPKPSLGPRHIPAPPAGDHLPDDVAEDPPDFLPPPPPNSGFGSFPPMSAFPPPPPPSFSDTSQDLPPPPPDPQMLLPPPPPSMISAGSGATAPGASLRPSGSIRKMPPPPPKRTTPSLHFMSELMMAMNKKRGDH
uniref:Amyloid beta A4 precursor protein-binding family B member 1-interacting protein n=1 Tax=Tetraodon nigroviridis TaxID=99883 RepID=H3D7Z6_TETNG